MTWCNMTVTPLRHKMNGRDAEYSFYRGSAVTDVLPSKESRIQLPADPHPDPFRDQDFFGFPYKAVSLV